MYIVGLGNPGEEYVDSRHNIGRTALETFSQKYNFSDWQDDKKTNSKISEGKIGKHKAMLMLPETYMNKTGLSVKKVITSKKKLQDLIVIYDEIDLPLGEVKIAHNRGSGGHRGLESVIKTLSSKEFTRIRVGISPATPSGKIKKPKGEKKVVDFVLGKFSKKEEDKLRKVKKEVLDMVESIVTEGRIVAMNKFN
ncbi:MAG: aminoacyl-tRNA hydrolase [Candidatus Pacebacteria bacterium]|nr:aminoacyl-tRNA hydrolase [Candidatus Paceibacterota bacterium]